MQRNKETQLGQPVYGSSAHKKCFFCGCCCFGFFLYGYGTEEGEEGGEVEDIKELSYGTGDISGNRERVMTV